ncbi:MAG: tetratricopeptide repeat protein [Maledivibacter sp.]|jgi:tetratricopeptide (TPR) repeat protein|nr:tetratricopeptide repeat protein [Maledivibacter sp.]
MFNRVEKYLKDRVNDVIFIHLKENKKLEVKGFTFDDSIPLPMPFNEVVNRVKVEDSVQDISILKIIEGMVYIMGVDSGFKHNNAYKEFLMAFDENIINVILQQGFRLIEAGNKVEALICFKACLYIKEDDLDSMYNYARCLEEVSEQWSDKHIKDFEDEAFEIFEKITNLYPDFSLSYYHLGFHYLNKKLYKKAEITWEKCIEKGIDENKESEIVNKLVEISYKVQYEEGYNLVLNGRPNEALKLLLPLEEVYSDWWNLQFFIGLAYRQLGDFEEALEYFEKSYRIQPNQADILNEIGLCNISLGRINEAIKHFEIALSIKGNDSEILCNLGIAYLQRGELKEAAEYINKSLQINPHDEVTLAWHKKIQSIS